MYFLNIKKKTKLLISIIFVLFAGLYLLLKKDIKNHYQCYRPKKAVLKIGLYAKNKLAML